MMEWDQQADKAIVLRIAGWTLAQIAVELGYADRTAVHRAVVRRRKRIVSPLVADLREMQDIRLEALHKAAWPGAVDKDVDAASRQKAIHSVLGIMARRAALMGIDKVKDDAIPREEVRQMMSHLVLLLQQYVADERRDEFQLAVGQLRGFGKMPAVIDVGAAGADGSKVAQEPGLSACGHAQVGKSGDGEEPLDPDLHPAETAS
jgi:hypothetical protein